MAGETYFVPTDMDGTQHHGDEITKWPLPTRTPEGDWQPGEPVAAGKRGPLVLRDLGGLLGDLGERIFVAEWLTAPGEAGQARLTAETEWTLHHAARFALDCVDRVVPDADGLKLPSGASVGDILKAARGYLDEDEQSGVGLLQRMSRIASARRLRHLGDEVGDLAFVLTVEDEKRDLDALDDPTWTAIAAIRDAVLSVVEAIRHDAFPKLFEAENIGYEAELHEPRSSGEVVSTPWGNFMSGSRTAGVPAWVAARDAAERARQAMTETNGQEVGERVTEWQCERLAEALGVAHGPSRGPAGA